MKQCNYLSWLIGGTAFFYLTMTSPIQAQIIQDTTLPNNSSVKTQGNTKTITGGTRAGGNLFHSFEQFSVPTDGVAFFNNAADVQNIISRVTGESVSNINGLLKANGIANLFLLNPNGIIFGRDASLDIGGSFLASTASSLKFTDGKEFSATEPQTAPLLSVSVPVGLQFGVTPGGIRNQSRFQSDPTAPYPDGLKVKPGKTLALVGSNIALEGGYLTAAGGRIEVGSVAGSSLVSLNPTKEGWFLSYDGVKSFQDIQLSEEAYIESTGIGGGSIQVQGRRITLTEGSQIAAFTQGTPGGTLTVTASESVKLIGVSTDGSFPSALLGGVEGLGDAVNVKIDTKQLIIQGGAQVSTTSEGQRGDLTVTASESVELVGTSADGVYKSGLFTDTIGAGDAGDLTIETRRLLVRDGARAISETSSAGQGGTLTVTASESVELIDVGRKPDGEPLTDEFDRPLLSGLFAQTGKEAMGPGGDLSISTKKLTVRDGAQVSSTTFGTQDAGNLTVRAADIELVGAVLSANGQVRKSKNDLPFSSGLFAGTEENSTGDGRTLDVKTDRLSLRDGAVLQTSTLGAGKAGDLTVQASESVELIGTTKDGEFPTSFLAVSGGPFRSLGIDEATGQGGNIDIKIGTTGNLLVQDGAVITVSSINPNKNVEAGNITVTAPTISLNNGDITAETASGKGGDITIQVPNLLLLRNNSNISTSAGSARVGGDGGNIEIDTNSIVAVPQENSDITANAFSGEGGNVDIEVQGDIFGLEPRSRQELQSLLEPDDPLDPERLDSNDITAISQTNPSLSGDVTINTPDVDPSEGVVTLPDVPVSVAVAQGCQATGSKQASVEFFNTGKGGLAPSPYEPLSSSETWEDVPQGTKNLAGAPHASDSPTIPSSKIVEAQGWSVNETGEVVLVAEVPPGPSQRRCHLR